MQGFKPLTETNKSRSYSNPEEKFQAKIFLKLVLEYGYPVEHIEQFKTVTMGADKIEADIIVHENAEWDKPKIVVECKKQEVSQQEFNQGFSYASALSGTVKFVWITSGILNEFYRFYKDNLLPIVFYVPHINPVKLTNLANQKKH